MPATTTVQASGIQDIDGILSGVRWTSGALSYSFPASASFYGTGYSSDNEPGSFSPINAAQQAAVGRVLAIYSAVANLTFSQVTESSTVHGTIRYAMTDASETAWAYYPANDSKGRGGDVWLNKIYYNNPIVGEYAFATFLHETGHALGLSHGHEVKPGFPALPSNHDSLEYSVMTYRSYVGDTLASDGYTVENGGYPQTLMMDDIAALQYMYGANFATNSGNTTYSWSSTTGEMFVNGIGGGRPSANRILDTVWDGGGNDTYDFSNYTTNLVIDLRPGGWNTTSSAQLSHLDYYGSDGHIAVGNIANALLYGNDLRSLIENAEGGAGNDTIIGNQVANFLQGLAGNDTLNGGAGDDVIDGGANDDTAVFSGARSSYTIVLANGGIDVTGPDGHDFLKGVEHLAFADQTYQPPTSAHNFNGDWDSDLLLRTSSGALSVMLVQDSALANWWVVGNSSQFNGWSAVGTGDFDRSGTSDILLQKPDGTISEVLMQNGSIANWWTIVSTPGSTVKATGDLNADGTTDMVLQSTSGQVSEVLTKPDGSLAAWYNLINAPGWNVVGTGDFNRDGTSDVLLQNAAGDLSEMTMQNGTVTNWWVFAHAAGWNVKATGDVNADGTTDILLQNASGQVSDMIMQNAALQNWWGVVNAPGWNLVDTGDVNHDGTADLLLQNSAGDVSEVLMHDSALANWWVVAHAADWTLLA